MEKNLRRIRTIAILIIAISISIIAFCGIFVIVTGVWENLIPEFNYGMELSGMRELRFVLDDSEEEKKVYIDSNGKVSGEVIDNNDSSSTDISLEEAKEEGEGTEKVEEEKEDNIPEGYTVETRTIKANDDDIKNKENFEKTKKVIQKRLEKSSAYEYNIRLNDVTGELILEVPDNDDVKKVESAITTVGKLEIIDYQNGLLLMDESGLKNASAVASSTENGYQAYLILRFDKNSAATLKDISNKYVKVTEAATEAEPAAETTEESEENEENQASAEETINYIQIKIDGQAILQTYFGQELANGVIQIPVGNATEDTTQFNNVFSEVSQIAESLNSGKLPLKYSLGSDNYIKSSIDNNTIRLVKIAFAVIIVIVSIYLIIRYRLNGLKAAIMCVGYIGLLIIIIKYTRIIITVNAAIALLGTILINYLLVNKVLYKIKQGSDIKISFRHSLKEVYLVIIPICVISVIFTFMYSTIISSIGMVLFWGLFISAIYNCLLMLILRPNK